MFYFKFGKPNYPRFHRHQQRDSMTCYRQEENAINWIKYVIANTTDGKEKQIGLSVRS